MTDRPPVLEPDELKQHFVTISDIFPVRTREDVDKIYERIEANKRLAAQAQRDADIKWFNQWLKKNHACKSGGSILGDFLCEPLRLDEK